LTQIFRESATDSNGKFDGINPNQKKLQPQQEKQLLPSSFTFPKHSSALIAHRILDRIRIVIFVLDFRSRGEFSSITKQQ